MAISDEKIVKALLAFDRNADGKLLPNELILSQLSLGVFLPREEREKFDAKAGAGLLEFDKAFKLVQTVSVGKNPKKELPEMFAHFDQKKDGTISAAELKAVLENLGEILTEPQIDNIIQKFQNNDRIVYRDLIDHLLE